MSSVEFVCRVTTLASAPVFSTPPHSPLCLPFAALLLETCSGLPPSDWPLSLGCRLPLSYGCAQETSMKEMIGDGRRIGWLAVPWIVGGEGSGCFLDVLWFWAFGLIFCFCYFFFLFRPFSVYKCYWAFVCF
ncbi:hypothetical protein C1H46_039091 [Malus baccata]|uniref:Uncharacterized protein n=1 Tax=Malus baccata TaxID=106549 RepID=A0A540KMG1_MALBA|nr:hypothetical protein C1H46_039091 [Malus baccata]